MKPMTALMTAAVFSVLSLNACGGSEKSMSIQEQTEARFQLNPHPKQAYRLRIKINDAPGPLKLMGKFGVGYKAENCSYVINRMEGAPANPEKDVETQVRQLGEFEYETVVYADAVLDEEAVLAYVDNCIPQTDPAFERCYGLLIHSASLCSEELYQKYLKRYAQICAAPIGQEGAGLKTVVAQPRYDAERKALTLDADAFYCHNIADAVAITARILNL